VTKSFDESDGTYGYRRVHTDLVAWGVPAGPELVRSVMRELGLEPNDIKLNRNGHQPEEDPGQRGQPGGLAGFAGLVPAAGAFGLALVAASRPQRDEVAGAGDLEGQVGGEVVQAVRGKSIRSR
jgi:hypothetical protein